MVKPGNNRVVLMTANASGAVEGARLGCVVMVVDVIDMSTTLEAALEAGAAAVYGASPDSAKPPVVINPAQVGYLAGCRARKLNTGVIVVAEPRIGTEETRRRRAARAIWGVQKAGAKILEVLPNAGAETVRLRSFAGKVVLAVTDSGGVVFDAALKAGVPVVTGTVARTLNKKGSETAEIAVNRVIEVAEPEKRGIAVVAASANAIEDVLAAEYITKLIFTRGFTNLG